jgi:hypothetical protein
MLCGRSWGQVFTFDVAQLEPLFVLNSQWACHQTMANLEDTQPTLLIRQVIDTSNNCQVAVQLLR